MTHRQYRQKVAVARSRATWRVHAGPPGTMARTAGSPSPGTARPALPPGASSRRPRHDHTPAWRLGLGVGADRSRPWGVLDGSPGPTDIALSDRRVVAGAALDPATCRAEASSADGLRALGAELRRLRLAADVDLDVIADAAGFSGRGAVAHIEAGGVATRASRLRPWLAALGVDEAEGAAFLARHAGAIAPESRFVPRAPRPHKPRPPRAVRQLTPPEPDVLGSDRAALGGALWRLRAKRGLSRPALAHLVGVTRVHVWLVERGMSGIRLSTLERWCAALGAGVVRPWELAKLYPEAVERDRQATVAVPPGLSEGSPAEAQQSPRRDP